MKITIESSNKIVELNGVPARIWEGQIESGIKVHCFVTLDERVYELVDRMLSNGTANCDLKEEMKKGVLVGYNLHREVFDN